MKSISIFLMGLGLVLFWGNLSKSFAAGFIDNKEGVPYRWKQGTPITYRLDPGNLGPIANATARTLVSNAFSKWENVSIASGLDFMEGADLPADVDQNNYDQYVTLNLQNVTSDTVIIFDSNGGILDLFLGGQSGTILGLGSPGQFDESTLEIKAGFAIINGAVSGVQTSAEATMTHEFGHILNLAHTQINLEEHDNSDPADDDVIPTMFPFLPQNAAVLTSLEVDDQFSIGFLYPDPVAFQARGSIAGKVLRRSGTGVQAVNVVCRNQSNPRQEAVSWVSDQELNNDGSYVCGNLSSGSYTVEIEPITTIINIFDPDPPFIPSEFYSGQSESFDPEIDTLTSSTSVSVTEGTPTSDINIVLNEDGRLVSGQTVTNTVSGKSYSNLEYFVHVPAGATSVRFTLNALTSNLDIDLYGRCDSEFSLSPIAPSIYLPDQSTEQQSEFAGDSADGVETIELTSSSSPALQECTYHLLVENLSSQSTEFELTATIDGKSPRLSFKDGDEEIVNEGVGEIVVFNQNLEAQGDTFLLQSLLITDQGDGNLSLISQAQLYEDIDKDGAVSSSDRLVTVASDIDTSSREILFSGLQEEIEAETTDKYLVTYTVQESSAGISFWFVVFLIGIFSTAFGKKSWKLLSLSTVCVVISLGLSCGTKKSGFHPKVERSSDVGVTGLTFGSAVQIQVGGPSSVKEFFE